MEARTLTEYLRDRVAYIRSEYPGEPIPREMFRQWREDWTREVRDGALQGRTLDLRVARSYLRVWGREAMRDLRYLDNASEIARQPWACMANLNRSGNLN